MYKGSAVFRYLAFSIRYKSNNKDVFSLVLIFSKTRKRIISILWIEWAFFLLLLENDMSLKLKDVPIRRFKLIDMGYKNSDYLIQSNYGTKGNFEVVVPVEGRKLQYWYRDNDSLYRDWIKANEFGSGIEGGFFINYAD